MVEWTPEQKEYIRKNRIDTLLDDMALKVLREEPEDVPCFLAELLEVDSSLGAERPKVVAAKGSAPPPPPPPPPSADFFKKLSGPRTGSDDAARAALFADLAKGTDITKGLRKVSDSEKTHKNRDKQEARATDFSELEKRKAKRMEELEKKREGGKVVKRERVVRKEGKMWRVANVVGEEKVELGEVEMKEAVVIDDCEDVLVVIPRKINSVVVNECKRLNLLLEGGVVSSVEVSRSQKTQLQANGPLPSFTTDRNNELMLFTTSSSRDVEIVSTASSAVNVTFPSETDPEDDPIERPIPEQFVSTIQVVDGKPTVKTVPMQHAG